MDRLKSTPGYAESQIRLLLSELNSAIQSSRVTAVKNFSEYIFKFKPEIYEDAIDYFFHGKNNAATRNGKAYGILHWCGVESESHEGSLKRICSYVLILLHSLVVSSTLPGGLYGNVFYLHFISLPEEDLLKINFTKHIAPDKKSVLTGITGAAVTQYSRAKHKKAALELLSLISRNHINVEGEPDPIDVNILIRNNSRCKEKFRKWKSKNQSELLAKTIEQLKDIAPVVKRPTQWRAVNFRPIPIQYDEESKQVQETTIKEVISDSIPVLDPLGICKDDLRIIQNGLDIGESKLAVDVRPKRKHKIKQNQEYAASGSWLEEVIHSKDNEFANRRRGDDSDDDTSSSSGSSGSVDDLDELMLSNGFGSKINTAIEFDAVGRSILPTDKNFDGPFFLSLVHNNTSLDDFEKGLENVKKLKDEQGEARSNLVRSHFGLFVFCADMIEELRQDRRQEGTNESGDVVDAMLKKAQTSLDLATKDLQERLAPILEKKERLEKLKSREKHFSKIPPEFLMIPARLRELFEIKELTKFVEEYQGIQQFNESSYSGESLDIVSKVKDAAKQLAQSVSDYCIKLLTTPNSNYPELYAHAQIILQLENAESYSRRLDECYDSQLNGFKSEMNLIIDHFESEIEKVLSRREDLATLKMDNSEISAMRFYRMYGGTFFSDYNLHDTHATTKVMVIPEENSMFEGASVSEFGNLKRISRVDKSIKPPNSEDIAYVVSKARSRVGTSGKNVRNGIVNKRNGRKSSAGANDIFKRFESKWGAQSLDMMDSFSSNALQRHWMSSDSDDASSGGKREVYVEMLYDLRLTLTQKLATLTERWLPCILKLINLLSSRDGTIRRDNTTRRSPLKQLTDLITSISDRIAECISGEVDNGRFNFMPLKRSITNKDESTVSTPSSVPLEALSDAAANGEVSVSGRHSSFYLPLTEPRFSNSLAVASRLYLSIASMGEYIDESISRHGLLSPNGAIASEHRNTLSVSANTPQALVEKLLISAATSLHTLAKQATRLEIEQDLERLEQFCRDEWTEEISASSSVSQFLRKSMTSSTLFENDLGKTKDLSTDIVMELEYRINDCFLLTMTKIHGVATTAPRLEWAVGAVFEGAMRVITLAVTFLMKQALRWEDSLMGFDRDDQGEDDDDKDVYGSKQSMALRRLMSDDDTPASALTPAAPPPLRQPGIVDAKSLAMEFDKVLDLLERKGKTTFSMSDAAVKGVFATLRICITLRVFWIPKLWEMQLRLFGDVAKSRPLPALSSSSIQHGSHSVDYGMFSPDEREQDRRPDITGLAHPDAERPDAVTDTYSHLSKKPLVMTSLLTEWTRQGSGGAFSADSPIVLKIQDLVSIEEQLLRKYILRKTEAFGLMITSAYTCLIQDERLGKFGMQLSRECSHADSGGNFLPSHVSRLLLRLGNDKATLNVALNKMPLLSVSDSASTTNAIGGLKVHPPEGASGPQSQARPRSQRSNISTVDTYGNQHRGGQGSANNDDLSYPMDNNPFRQFLASVECDTDAAEPDDFDYTALTQADAAIGYKDFVFAEIFNGVLLIYSEMLRKLSSGYFSESNNPGKNSLPAGYSIALTGGRTGQAIAGKTSYSHPLTYAQACEEYDFLKGLFRHTLPSSIQHHWTHENFSKPRVKGEEMRSLYLSSEQLIQNSKILVVAIHN